MQVFFILIENKNSLINLRGRQVNADFFEDIKTLGALTNLNIQNEEIPGFINYLKGRTILLKGKYYTYINDFCSIDSYPCVNILVESLDEIHISDEESSNSVEVEKPVSKLNEENLNKAIISRIKELAEERGKTVAETAALGGINQSTISEIIHGRSKSPKVSTIFMYCKGCNITLSEFFSPSHFNY